MAYLDAPSIPETHIAMPLRSYAWGEGAQAADAITAHVAQHPAAAKTSSDPFTAKVARIPTAAPAPVLAAATGGSGAQGHAAPPASGGGAEDALEGLAAAAERIVATQRVDLGDVAPVERARLLEALERKGIIGPAGPGGDREVLVATPETIAEILDDGDPVAEYLATEDPSPEIAAGPDDEIADLTAEEAGLETAQEERRDLTPAESRAVLHDWLRRRAADGRPAFAMADLAQVRAQAGGKSRAWAYKALEKLESDGIVSRTDDGFVIDGIELLADPLDDEREGQPVRL
jgi:hypothetical protein